MNSLIESLSCLEPLFGSSKEKTKSDTKKDPLLKDKNADKQSADKQKTSAKVQKVAVRAKEQERNYWDDAMTGPAGSWVDFRQGFFSS